MRLFTLAIPLISLVVYTLMVCGISGGATGDNVPPKPALPYYQPTQKQGDATYPFTGPGVHLIYCIVGPDYLGLTKGADWEARTTEYLGKLWETVKGDPDPALLIYLCEKGTPSAEHPEWGLFTKDRVVESDKIVAICKACERYGISFFIQVAGGGTPTLSLSTCERIFGVAPKTCKGMFLCETFNTGQGWNYIPQFIAFRDLCKKHRVKMVWAEHSRDGTRGMGWWGYPLANNKEWNELFSREYADVFVPLHEDNDPRVESLNMGACMGMWLGGLSKDWGWSVQDWWWNDSGYGDIKTCPGEIISRVLLEAASLGSTYFEFEHPQMTWEEGTWKPNRIYKEGIQYFLDLYRKGQVPIPSKRELLSVSPVALRLNKWNGHDWRIMDSDAGNKKTPEDYIPNYFYHEKDYHEGLIPQTPYGILALFPSNVQPWALKGKHVFDVDGSASVYEGQDLSGDATRETILSLVNKDTAAIPLRVENAYGVLTRLGDDKYMVWLLNSKEKDPEPVTARLTFSLPASSVYTVRDRGTGESLGRLTTEMNIPLDRYRLLEIQRVK